MNIRELLSPECVLAQMEAANATAAITELVDALHTASKITDRDAVLSAVLERERIRSTGIGHGLAVPHGKSSGCPALTMALGKPVTPIDFGSSDDQQCRLVVLVTSPIDATGPHIQALARISRLWLNETSRNELIAAESSPELYEAVVRHFD